MAASVTNTGLPSTVNNRADFTGGSINSGATCSIQISVRAFQRTPAGNYTNTIPTGRVTTAEGATNDLPVSSILGVTGLSIAKAFAPNSIPLSGISRLTITINNPSPLPYSVTSLLDDLNSPTNSYVSIAPTPNTNTTCVGGIVTTGPRTVTLNGGTVPAGGSCNFSVDVIGTTVGNNRTNTIPAGRLTTVEGGTNASAATALISITNVLPTSTKAFTGVSGNNQIVAGGTSTLTITLTNPAGATALTNLGFVDNLATTGTGLVFTSLTSNTCGGSVTGAGTQVITFKRRLARRRIPCTFLFSSCCRNHAPEHERGDCYQYDPSNGHHQRSKPTTRGEYHPNPRHSGGRICREKHSPLQPFNLAAPAAW